MNNKTTRDEPVIAYMDLTDFEHELGYDSNGTVVYAAPEDVLRLRKCAMECGVVEVEIRFRRIVMEPRQDETNNPSP